LKRTARYYLATFFAAPLAVKKTNGATLALGDIEDPLYFAPHRIEQRNRILRLKNFFRMVDNYTVGNLYIRVTLRRLNGPEDFKFVFFRVSAKDVAGARVDTVHDCVFFDVCELIHGPEGVIPSFVWFEGFKESENFRGEAIFKPLDFVRPVIRIGAERERRETAAIPMLPSNSVGHLVETGAQVVDGIKQNTRAVVRPLPTRALS